MSMSGGGGNGMCVQCLPFACASFDKLTTGLFFPLLGRWTPTWPSVFLPRPSGPARKLEQCLNPPSFVLSSTQPRSHRTLDTPRLSLFAAHMSNVTAARCIVHTRFLSVFARRKCQYPSPPPSRIARWREGPLSVHLEHVRAPL